jgi:hypothetical protein
MNRLAGALRLPAGCLAILGSRTESRHPHLTSLLESLQNLISTTVTVQEDLRQEAAPRGRKGRRAAVRQ